MTFISYSQNSEDVLLWRALRHVERGFYVDVGAQHPDIDSVTRAFHERGWRGVNVEPSAEYAALLRAARPDDVTLELALGAEPGEAEFLDVPGTGLSTLDPSAAARLRADGHFPSRTRRVPVSTLAEVARRHAPGDTHFLKIDVEGAEREVLRGADLFAFRPWIVVVEATAPGTQVPTHGDWEPVLGGAGYEFVFFDGLNRFYLAPERADALRPCFAAPPNVFDDFIRPGDGAWFSRVAAAEAELSSSRAALGGRDRELARLRGEAERDALELSRLREMLHATTTDNHELSRVRAAALHRSQHELHQTHLRLRDATDALRDTEARLRDAEALLRDTDALSRRRLEELDAVRTSHSWTLTAPIRRAARAAKRVAGRAVAPEPDAATPDATPAAPAVAATVAAPGAIAAAIDAGDEERPPLPVAPPPPFPGPASSRPVGAVHQFHSGSAVGDAVTNAMLLTRRLLREAGFESEIYTEQPAAGLEHELKPFELIPRHDRYVLLLRHSMGYDRFEQVLALPARKVLLYHNITPPELLRRHPVLEHYAALGRKQLAGFRGRVEAVLADSEYNLIELRRLGIGPAEVCTLLFDPAVLRGRAEAAAAAPRAADAPFTVLFVGRVVESKNQLALVEAFGRFRAGFGASCRLVLAGRHDGEDDPYLRALRERIAGLGLDNAVEITGAVDDPTLHRHYAHADLYVSASRHEGFGVPLVEAMAHGVPVLAWPAGAVPYTLFGAARLLPDLSPDAVAAAMLALARDPRARDRQRRNQRAALDRLALPAQVAVLRRALSRAGAEPAAADPVRAVLEDNLRISVHGHVNGSYSLAVINRELARRLAAALPDRVRLQPVEGAPTADLSGVPEPELPAIRALAERPPHATGPELVVSQHYPVFLPGAGGSAGDVRAALLFWEESLLPRATVESVCAGFDAVVAPTAFVRDALLDSGCRLPVRVIPPAVVLDRFAALRAERRPDRAAHRFLHVSSGFPRKGVDVLLRAWARAFRAGDAVRLLIKAFPNPHNEVAAGLDALRRDHPALAPVELVDRDLDDAAMLALFRDADTMVLPSRGEGLNLPAAEAMAAGLGLIVTEGGGHLDFVRAADGAALPGVRLVPARPAPSGTHLATAHSFWLEPDEDALVAALRGAAGNDAADPPPVPHFPDATDLGRRYGALALDVLERGAALARPVRVSWVSTWNLRCGVSEYSRQLLGAIEPERRGALEVRVLCDRRTPRAELDPDDRYWPCWELGDPRSVAPIVAAIAADDPDAVVFQQQPGLLSFEMMAAVVRHPDVAGRVLVATLHNTRYLSGLDEAALADALDGLRRLDRVLVHTEADLHRLRALGLSRAVSLLPQGVAVPTGLVAPPPVRILEPHGPREAGPVIGCYGFLLPGKGVDTLIEAFALLRARWPHARLSLVNALHDHAESREELERCRALVERHRLDDAVALRTAFLPHAESLRLLGGCDVVVLPYRPSLEASSAALRGALASGAPVAVTPIALFDEAGEAVFRLPDFDADAIAAGLHELLSDRERRQALRNEAERWMAARRWEDVAFRMAGLVTGLVRSRVLGNG